MTILNYTSKLFLLMWWCCAFVANAAEINSTQDVTPDDVTVTLVAKKTVVSSNVETVEFEAALTAHSLADQGTSSFITVDYFAGNLYVGSINMDTYEEGLGSPHTITVPAQNYFRYSDPSAESKTITLSLKLKDNNAVLASATVSALNTFDPVSKNYAVNDSFDTAAGKLISIDVLANDEAPYGAQYPVCILNVTNVDSDKLSLDIAAEFTVWPVNGFLGESTLNYELGVQNGSECVAIEGDVKSIATVTINVISLENFSAVADAASVEYSVASETTTIDVLANDVGANLTITAFDTKTANNGTVTQNGKKLSYTPSEGFEGVDTFTYTVTSDQLDEESSRANLVATVTITVKQLTNEAPAPTGTVLTEGTLNINRTTLSERQQKGAAVVETLCVNYQAHTSTYDKCSRLSLASDAVLSDAIDDILPSAVLAQSQSANASASAQMSSVQKRLILLRQNARDFSVDGLTVQIEDEYLPIGQLFTALSQQQGWTGGAAGDDFSRLSFFIDGDYTKGERDDTQTARGYDLDIAQLNIGADYRLTSTTILGGSLGYGQTGADYNEARGTLDSKNYYFTAYGNYYPTEKLYVDGLISYGMNDFDSTRNILVGTIDEESATSSPKGQQVSMSVSVGGDLNHEAWLFSPYGRIEYVYSEIDAYSESGDVFALKVEKQRNNVFDGVLGGRLGYVFSTGVGVFIPTVYAEWAHHFESDGSNITASFVNDPTNTTFEYEVNDKESDTGNVGLSITGVFAHGVSAFINYETLVAHSYAQSQTMALGARWEY